MQLSPYGLLLLTQALQSSEQHIRANLEFSSNFALQVQMDQRGLMIYTALPEGFMSFWDEEYFSRKHSFGLKGTFG